jgi:hypothetical protein
MIEVENIFIQIKRALRFLITGVCIVFFSLLAILALPFVTLGMIFCELIKFLLGVVLLISTIIIYFVILATLNYLHPNPIIPQIAGYSVLFIVFIVLSPLFLGIVSSGSNTIIYKKY